MFYCVPVNPFSHDGCAANPAISPVLRPIAAGEFHA
jgi:hypothetical protein